MSLTNDIAPSDMLLFVAVVREGGFTSAARELGLTKQSVSERVARLEERLGVRLLERTTRRVRPTDAGEAYYERCSLIAAQIEEANALVREREAEPAGLLRISSPGLYGRRLLSPVVADYLARYPRMRVEVVLADRRVNLVEEGFHLAIRIGKLDDSTLVAARLGDGFVHCVASPAWLARRPAPSLRTLASARCIGVRGSETWSIGAKRIKISPVLVVNDLELACQAAIDGVGIARVPSLVCRDAVRTGRLEVLFPREDLPRPQPVHVVYPSRRHLPSRVRLFIDTLASLVAPMEPVQRGPRASSGRA